MAKGLWPVINVENVEKSVEFYKGIGLKATLEDTDMPGAPPLKFGQIVFGDSGLLIWNKHAMGPDQPADTKAWLSGEMGKGVLFTIGVPNATKCWEKVKALRVAVDSPLEAQPWGGHGFSVSDPDGYTVNVTDKFPDMDPAPKKKAAKKSVKTGKKSAKKSSGKKRR